MDSEIRNFIMVWVTTYMSVGYCYAITKLLPKGILRLIMFMPVLYLFFALPLHLNTIMLGAPTAFLVTWLATFKLILLVFDDGPLSTPSLSLVQFTFVACCPVVLQKSTTSVSSSLSPRNLKDQARKSLVGLAEKAAFLIFIIYLGFCQDKIPECIFFLVISFFVYVSLELLLETCTSIGKLMLRIELEPGFRAPYLSTSLQDYWGHRWNWTSSSILRLIVYNPLRNGLSKTIGNQWAQNLATLSTFLVSALMHEIIFYYMTRTWSIRGTPLFFLMHGMLLILERILKRMYYTKWQVPQMIAGPLILVFAFWSFSFAILPELLRQGVDDRGRDEIATTWALFKDLGFTWWNWYMLT